MDNRSLGGFLNCPNIPEVLMKKNRRIKTYLENIVKLDPKSLKAEVANEALAFHIEQLEVFFKDLSKYGCRSGIVSSLIYYSDTHSFYDRHYDEIEDIRFELENSFGDYLRPSGDLKNWFAWLAFEYTAQKIADDLSIYF